MQACTDNADNMGPTHNLPWLPTLATPKNQFRYHLPHNYALASCQAFSTLPFTEDCRMLLGAVASVLVVSQK